MQCCMNIFKNLINKHKMEIKLITKKDEIYCIDNIKINYNLICKYDLL